MCDLNWIQNQTNLVLNKWLASTNFAKSSTPTNVSNSTAAQHQQQTRRAWDAKQHSHQRAHNASYSHWPTAATSWARTRPLAQTQMQQHAAARAVRANSSPSATKWIRADQAAAGATVSESTRVLQGPKVSSIDWLVFVRFFSFTCCWQPKLTTIFPLVTRL